MKKPYTLAVDAGIGVALAAAILLVYVVEGQSPRGPSDPGAPTGANTLKVNILHGEASQKDAKPVARSLRLGVTPRKYDDLGSLLKDLGKGYQYTEIPLEVLKNPVRSREFDVIFLTCDSGNESDRDLIEGVRQYVANGGTLYASDLRFAILANAFSGFLEAGFNPNAVGKGKQTVRADVVDAGLKEHLGNRPVDLYFDLDDWRPASFRRDKVTTYLEGSFETKVGKLSGPLMIRFTDGRGTVIFTSFHNAANSAVGSKLLEYLVFTAVTSQVESKVAQTMIESGFAPRQSSLITVASGAPTVTKAYTNKKAGKLRFALGFNPENARLRLTVRAPDGRFASAEHTSSFTIEVPEAPAGEWSYTVTAVQVPYPNFPFRVTVGEDG